MTLVVAIVSKTKFGKHINDGLERSDGLYTFQSSEQIGVNDAIGFQSHSQGNFTQFILNVATIAVHLRDKMLKIMAEDVLQHSNQLMHMKNDLMLPWFQMVGNFSNFKILLNTVCLSTIGNIPQNSEFNSSTFTIDALPSDGEDSTWFLALSKGKQMRDRGCR